MILTIKDNIINSKEEMICHQVNCKGVMGKGVALAIKNKYRYAYTQYKAFCKNKEVKDLIGRCNIVKVQSDINPKYIANMFAQENYGYGKCFTNYEAFEICILHVLAYCNMMEIKSIAMPYKIGCGNAGGNWNIIYSLLEKYFGINGTNREIKLIWDSSYSGQFDITCGNVTKTIVVESLF